MKSSSDMENIHSKTQETTKSAHQAGVTPPTDGADSSSLTATASPSSVAEPQSHDASAHNDTPSATPENMQKTKKSDSTDKLGSDDPTDNSNDNEKTDKSGNTGKSGTAENEVQGLPHDPTAPSQSATVAPAGMTVKTASDPSAHTQKSSKTQKSVSPIGALQALNRTVADNEAKRQVEEAQKRAQAEEAARALGDSQQTVQASRTGLAGQADIGEKAGQASQSSQEGAFEPSSQSPKGAAASDAMSEQVFNKEHQQQADQNLFAGSPIPNPSDVDFTPPLIQSLVDLARLHGQSVSARRLTATLPKTSGTIHPSACLRAAREAGLIIQTVYRPSLAKLSHFTLPCILILQEGQSCVLTETTDTTATCIFPELNFQKKNIPIEELEKVYLGYAIFAKPVARLDARASKIKLIEQKQWFWGTLAHFLPIYKHVVGASLLVNLLAICGPLFFMTVYDRVVPNKATTTLWMLASGIILAYIFDFLLRNLRGYFVDVAGRNADVILASQIMKHVLSMRLDVKPDSAGSLANNLREFESLRDFFGSTTLMTLVDLPFLFVFVAIIFFIGGPLGVIPLLAIPIVVGAGIFLQRPLQNVTEKGFKENMQKNALLYEVMGGLEAIKATMAEGRIQHAWENVVGLSASSNAHTKGMANLSMTLTMIVTQLVSISLIIWGVYRINEGLLTMGGLIAANMLSGRAMAPLSQIASMLSRLQQSRMALLSLDQIMSLETEEPENGEYIEFGYLEPTLTLEDVSFKYPNTERHALDRVNLRINPGEKIGIIGRMGSGKTTFGRLCVGFYRPLEGAVKFGGVDIRQMDTVALRSRVGYVAHDNYLFYGTVRENISFGALEADDRMILRAANIAGVTDFVKNHPAGFGMPVGERGMSLSGGQRQSVAIARALLHDPDILILDEPSSNMDNAAEHNLKMRLQNAFGKDKTLILITHRFSMLTLVDRLIIIDDGKILADGPRDQVLRAISQQPKS